MTRTDPASLSPARLAAAGTLVALAAFAAPLAAQRDWAPAQTAVVPNAQLDLDIAYDLRRGRTVLFGGRDSAGVHWSETWEFDGAAWTQATPAGAPSARAGARMAYDGARGVVVLFGGFDPATGTSLGDTWIFDGASWTQQSPASSPAPRHGGGLWYDTVRQKVMLFGGTSNNTRLDDTWAWDGSVWTQLAPRTRPSPRFSIHVAYDYLRDRGVLFGGAADNPTGNALRRLADTWEWDGTDWRQQAPPHAPTPRWGHKVAFSLAARRTVLFGGNTGGFVDDTWEWDGFDWHPIQTAAKPTGRDNHAMTYDWIRGRAIVYGGYPPGHDTWEYFDRSPARFARLGYGCQGSAGTPSLDAATGSVPALGSTFTLLVKALPPAAGSAFGLVGAVAPPPIDLTAIGMTGCVLFARPDIVVAFQAAAGSATWQLPIPNTPVLSGARFYLQGVVIDPGGNPLGLVLSNAGEGIFG